MTQQVFADAQQAIGFARPALYRAHATVFEEKYPAFNYASLVPVNEDGDMWDVGTIVTSLSGPVGQAEYISAKGFDIPNASSGMSQGVSTFHLAGIGYELSLGEVNRAARMGVELNGRQASNSRKIAEKFVYDRVISGSTEKNFTGLINNASVPAANATTGSWGSATPDQQLADVNQALTDVYTNTKETEVADTLLLPTSRFISAGNARITDANVTVLEFLRQNNTYTLLTGQPLTIMPSRELETAGATSSKRMVAMAKNPGVLEFFLPGAYTFMPPFAISSLAWRVDGIMNVGQLEIYRPKGLSYRDGI